MAPMPATFGSLLSHIEAARDACEADNPATMVALLNKARSLMQKIEEAAT